jgi:hypothetical protein
MQIEKVKRQVVITLTKDENQEINDFLKNNPLFRLTPLTQYALLTHIRNYKKIL